MAHIARYWPVLVWGGSLLTCCAPPGAARIVGPDGSKMWHVHCGEDQAACFQIAGEQCPLGYEMSPLFDPREGNFLVRCRGVNPSLAARAAPNAPAAPVAEPATRPSTHSTASNWRPPEVATPAEPWPPASAESNAPPAPASTARQLPVY